MIVGNPVMFGGGGLAIKVIGGSTLPASAKENTFFVETSDAVTGYVFSFDAPENPENGLVWISMGTTGDDYPVDRDGTVLIRVGTAKQYSGGTWVDKALYCYKNGEWVQFIIWIYNNGDKFETLTGGYTFTKNSNGLYTDNSDTLGNFRLYDKGGTAARFSAAFTTNKIDVTNYSKLHASVDPEKTNTGSILIALTSLNTITANIASNSATVASKSVTTFTAGTRLEIEMDITSISGEYYPAIQSQNGAWIYVYELWFT